MTPEVKQKLTDEFKADNKKTVWNKPYIRNALLDMSHNKCCYCESLVGHGHKEMHIDHYKPKNLYPDLVVDWDNLLPSCPHCNKGKSDHNTGIEPIINPTTDNPKDYLYLKSFRYYSKSRELNSLGKMTIDVLNLNDSSKNVIERYRIGMRIQDTFQNLYDYALEFEDELQTNIRRRNRVFNGCRDLLQHGLPTSEFSAFMATTIHDDQCYIDLKELLERNGLWDSELQELHDATLMNKFDTHR